MKNVFDLDNTLVFTNELNNLSYLFALKKIGKICIFDCKRITREIVMEKLGLTQSEMNKIIKIKQDYFIKNIGKIKTNDALLNYLKKQNPNDCVLWTKADKKRVEAVLVYLNIVNRFNFVYYSDKKNKGSDLIRIAKKLNCDINDLVVFDDEK